MRTLQEKYNAIQEGNFSKDQFLVEARMQHPNLVTRYNGYKDAVQILKNRGMIKESSAEESFANYSNDALNDMIINMSRYEGNEDEIARVKSELQRRKETVNEASYKVSKNSKQAQHLKKGDIITSGDEIISVSAGAKTPAGKVEVTMKTKNGSIKTSIWGKTTMIGVKPVTEARLTKNSLTDYRYKPTNDMDKYPYEQILRGLRVELEVLGVHGTPTAEEYKKALGKVLKNLEKDEIFYTNQLAGNNKKVDLHDKFVDATAKNTVDTFNGMKKATIRESRNPDIQELVLKLLKKNPNMTWTQAMKKVKEDLKENVSSLKNLPDGKYFAIDGDWEEEYKGHNGLFFTLKGHNLIGSDGKNFQTSPEEFLSQFTPDEILKVEDIAETTLKEGIKNLIKKALMENEEDVYEMQGPKTDDEYKSELADYLEDNQIYGYTDMLFDILTAPDEEQVADNLADFLDDHQIYGYNKGLLAIFRDYANRDQSEDEWDEVYEMYGEDDIDYDDENFSDSFIDGEDDDDDQYICWDAGGGNYEIAKYDPNVSWHNDEDVFHGTYEECERHEEEEEENAYRFRSNMSHKSYGQDYGLDESVSLKDILD